jgi:hypothetical protein
MIRRPHNVVLYTYFPTEPSTVPIPAQVRGLMKHLFFITVFALSACDRMPALSLQAPAPAAAAPVAVVCPVRPYATCTPETLRLSLKEALFYGAAHSAATELWLSRPSEPATLLKSVPPHRPPRRASARTLEHERAQWIASTADELAALAQPFMQAAATSRNHGQRLAEAISLVAAAHASAGPRAIVLVSDGRESSRFGSADCSVLQADKFAPAVGAATLPSGTLKDVAVQFWFQTKQQPKVRSCISTPKKEQLLARSWQAAVSAAGGTISFHIGTSSVEVPVSASPSGGASPKE